MTTFHGKVVDRMVEIVRKANLDPIHDGGFGARGSLKAMDSDFNTIATASYQLQGYSKNHVQLTRYPIVAGSGCVKMFNFEGTDGEKIRAMLACWAEMLQRENE